MSSKLRQIWGDGQREWSLFKMRYSDSQFELIPQGHEEGDSAISNTQEHDSAVANKQLLATQHHDPFIENILSVATEPLPSQALHKGPIASHQHYSSAHLLSTKQLVGLTFFAVTGGPFAFEAAMSSGGPMLLVIGLFFFPFIWSIPLTLMTAEMACMIPESGGHVLWVYRAFGPFWSFVNSYFAFACSVLDSATYPMFFVGYLSVLLSDESGEAPLNQARCIFLKILVLSFVTIINILGVDVVGNVSLILASIVLVPLVIISSMGIYHINFLWMGNPIPERVDRGKFMALMLFNTSGFDLMGTCASEVRTPSHSYPRALRFGLLLIIGVYTLPALIGISIIPDPEKWCIGTYIHVAKIVGGPFLKDCMGIAAASSAVGLLLFRLCTNSRILYGMAQVDQMPSAFTLLHPSFATPWVAILTTSMCTLIFVDFFDLYILAEVDLLFYALSTLLKFGALVQLRYTEPDVLRPFQIPFEKEMLTVLTGLPMSMCIAMIYFTTEHSQGIALIGASLAVFAYIFKEIFSQYGIEEAVKIRLARVQQNIDKMQKRVDVVIENEFKVLQNLGSFM